MAPEANYEAPRPSFFAEVAKFLPVLFVVSNIVSLYFIYSFAHLKRLLHDPENHDRAVFELVFFNIITFIVVINYVMCIVTHPGGIPDSSEDSSWQYPAKDAKTGGAASGDLALHETKRSGDRRHCKWCAKWKPDRCHHCRVCRRCILRMDHHCPWIYNCVGFKNHKYFFLVLFYSAIDCHFIFWTQMDSLTQSINGGTPFAQMFFLIFGETLAAFLGIMVTGFFLFHCWLMMKAMTTIEFCEKRYKVADYDMSAYDRGFVGNICGVLGDNPFLWLLPCSLPTGRGLNFSGEEDYVPLKRDLERGRGIRSKERSGYGSSSKSKRKHGRSRTGGGTGSAPGSTPSLGLTESGGEGESQFSQFNDPYAPRDYAFRVEMASPQQSA